MPPSSAVIAVASVRSSLQEKDTPCRVRRERAARKFLLELGLGTPLFVGRREGDTDFAEDTATEWAALGQ
jgi:hypothetical protein